MTFIVGSNNEFDALLYPEQHQSVYGYMQEHLQTFSNTVTDIGASFANKAKELYAKLNDSSIMERARAVVRAAKGMMNYNVIYNVANIDDLRSASPVLQKWIMANPVIREKYLDQCCNGYNETYQNIHGNDIGVDHYDYRRVMHGMMEKVGNDYVVNHYYDTKIDKDEKPLEVDEQFIILDAWDIAEMCFAKHEDCTNPYGGKL